MPKEAFKDMWDTILAKKTWKGVVKNKKKDGSAYYVNATVKPILDVSGNIIEFISIRHDITEQILAKEAAQRALESKGTFFAKASHELRTPLNAIINFTEMVLEEFDDMFDNREARDQNLDFLNRIEKNSKHLLSLINDLLDISKLERKGLELAPVDLQRILQDAVDTTILAAKKKNLDLRMSLELNEISILANEKTLLQVFLNLLSNSIKFTDAGYVEVGTKELKDEIEIYIKDSGRGIPKEKIDKIFEPFEQVSEGDEGTGLGLKLVKEMCEAMRIRVLVESDENQGATFRLYARRA
jgi:signal transduction histidine kinase